MLSCWLRPGKGSAGRTRHPFSRFSFPSHARPLLGVSGGWGTEHPPRTPALDGPTACPSHQDLPDPMHDATQVQLPHCCSALHDETGEAPGGHPEPSPTSLALGMPPRSGAFAQALSSAWNTLPAAPSAPFWPPQGHLPRWTVSPLRAETVLASVVHVPRPDTVSINSETFLGMLPDTPLPQFSPNLVQKERFAALAKFKSSIYRILIATDVASR